MSSAQMPWRPSFIRKVVAEAKPTASQVVVVETDLGNGYLKAMGNRAGLHSLAVELVATRLAALLSMPTLTAAHIPVGSDPRIELEPGVLAHQGPGFITRAEEGSSWSGTGEELDMLDNPEHLAWMVSFDTWVRH
jgi:hypothetical protein